MLRRDLVCMQSCQSLHCSRTYTKWVCFWHILSVNVQTNLSMRAVSPDPSLLSHMHRKGVHTVYFISQCSDAHEHLCSFARAFTAFAHAQNGRKYLSVNAKTRLSMHAVKPERSLLSHIHKMSGLWHLLSANAQTSLSMRAVSPEPTLLSRMRKMSVHTAYSFSKCSDEP